MQFAVASAAKSPCKTLTDHATSYSTQGSVTIAMHECKKTREVPLNRGCRLKSVREKTHSEDTHRETASSESFGLARRFPGWAQTNGFSQETWSAGALGLVQHPWLTLERRQEPSELEI